jgi:ketosteroid isomerase-like protein
MRYSLIIVFLSFLSNTFAQNTIQKEIDDQVWKPFTEAITTQNVEKFLSVHSKDVVRVERDSKKILSYDQYKSNVEKGWPGWKESIAKNKTKYSFELRFTERLGNENTAYEVGYFKNESTNADGQVRKSFGKFHVVLRKEDGVWKILVDSDSNEGKSITEEMFLAAAPLN